MPSDWVVEEGATEDPHAARRIDDDGPVGTWADEQHEQHGSCGRILRYGVWMRPATSITMIFLLITLQVLPDMVLGPVKPSIIKSQFHRNMCPNITAAHRYTAPLSAEATSSEGYEAQADKDSSSGIVGAAAAPVAGYLSDRFGRRPVMVVSTLFLAVPLLALAATCDTAWYLPLSVVFGSVGDVGTQVAAYAYVADLTPRHLRSERYGFMLITVTAAVFVGAPLGGYLSNLWGETDSDMLFWVCFGIAMVPLLFSVLFLAEPRRIEEEEQGEPRKDATGDSTKEGVRDSWRRLSPMLRGSLGGYLLVSFLVNMQSTGTTSLISVYLTDAFPQCGPECLSAQYVAFAVTLAVANGVLLPLCLRLCGERGTLWLSLAGNFAHCLVFAFARRLWLIWANAFFSAFSILSYSVLTGLVSSSVPKDLVGSALGASNSLWMVTKVMSPLIFAYAFIEYSPMQESKQFPGLPWLLGALFVALSMCVLGLTGEMASGREAAKKQPLLAEEDQEGFESVT